jgi:hypothetical protein
MSQKQEQNQMNANNTGSSDNHEPEILEQGDIYFFYRPRKGAEEVKGIEDVRRFFMVTAPEKSENKESGDKNQFYMTLMNLQKISCQMNLEKVMQLDQSVKASMP